MLNKFTLTGAAIAATLTATAAGAATIATFGNPWGQKGTLDAAMDGAFGAGTWTDVASPTDTSFLAGEDFVYLEGDDSAAQELEDFLDANSTALNSWLSAGGAMLINSARNAGNGFDFGGL